MKKILFVCTGNTCRSPMAEGIFNKLASEKSFNASASSAGLFVTDSAVSENAITIAAQNGIDISGHIPRQLTNEILGDCDIVLTMTNQQKSILNALDNVYTIAEYFGSDKDVSDPYGGDIDIYKKTFDELYALIGNYNEN